MKKLIFGCLFTFAITCIAGCPDVTEIEKERTVSAEIRTEKIKGYVLPPDATNIKNLTKGWYSFDLEINNKNHTFLCRINETTHGFHVVTFTEISK